MLITADDFGMTKEINEACVELFNNRKIDGVSFMVKRDFSLQGAHFIKKHMITAGLHIDLTGIELEYEQIEIEIETQIKSFIELTNNNPSWIDFHFNLNFKYPIIDLILEEILNRLKIKCEVRKKEASCELYIVRNNKYIKDFDFIYCHPTLPIEKNNDFISDEYFNKRLMDFYSLSYGNLYLFLKERHNYWTKN